MPVVTTSASPQATPREAGVALGRSTDTKAHGEGMRYKRVIRTGMEG